MRNDPEGYVYVQTNDTNNEVVVFARDGNGALRRLDSYLTGGKGSGAPHLQSQGSIVLAGGWLFVTNAGSDDVTVFAADGGRLELVDRAASGGRAPRSVAIHDGHVYVLNAGDHPSIAMFSFDGNRLVPVSDATHLLDPGSDPAQVAITHDGTTVLVTDRAVDAIHAFAVADDARLVDIAVTYRSSGATPYGFDVTADGVLVVTEAAGAKVGKASASSYKVEGAAQLSVVSGAVQNTRSEVCWAVIGNDGRTAFVTNFGDGTISTYSIGEDGSIELREAVAATTVEGRPGIRDEALSPDGRYLYALHADTGQVFGWAVDDNGSLAAVGSANGLPLTAAGLAAS